jgi:hypothetical protein
MKTTASESQPESVELEVIPPTALESMERASIDVQIATAHRYPRSVAAFHKRANEIISYDEETASSCVYRRPVGGGKIAEGASVRLAEIVAACWGNVRVSAMIVEQTERMVKCQGFAHDLESNTAVKSEAVEPTVMKDGRPYSEGQRAVVAKACLAKARRDAIFSVIPRAMCKPLMDIARKVAIGDASTLEARRQKAKDYTRSIKVEDARVFAVLQVKGWPDVGLDHLETLTGLRTAIQDQDTTVDEAFPQVPKQGNAQTTGAPPPPVETAKAPERPFNVDKPYDEIVRFCKEDGVNLTQVYRWSVEKKIVDPAKCEEIGQTTEAKLRIICQTWNTILPAIKQQAAE